MRPRSSTSRNAGVIAVSALVLAACSSGGETTTTNQPSSSGSESSSSSSAPSSSAPAKSGDGELVVGTLLPQTGDLAFLGPPEFAGVGLAIKDINAAGGVLGKDIKQIKGDSGDGTPNVAPGNTRDLLDGGSDVIVGAASSSVSLSVIDAIVGAGVVQISPANTSTAFDTYDDKGLYFRTAPSDVLQGAVLANLVAEDQHDNVAILARQDSYGEALADQVDKVFTANGGNVTDKVLYDANASTFGAEVQQVAASKPDAVVLIAFNETTKIIPEMIKNNIGPDNLQVYFVDGNTADYSKDFPQGTLDGVKATYPGAELTNDFRSRMLTVDKGLDEFTYGPESYDATVLAALAATAAKDDSGEAIASQLQAVSEGGTKCTTYEECAQMLESGEDIDYDGVSGAIDFNDTGSPSSATIGIFQYGPDNTYTNLSYVDGQI
jgi:ABC-type branched-subunit amino acid transport system substrate-binding protein